MISHRPPFYSLVNLGFHVGFTLILLGYLMVWLPQPVNGLSFIGLEVGEWVKFLPQVKSGEIVPGRNLFYLPPITLGLMILMWTVEWPERRWRTWLMRAVAVLVTFLAFPSIEVILNEPEDQWLLRILLIGAVSGVMLLVPILKRGNINRTSTAARLLIVVLGLAGVIFPTWAYLALRPVVGELFRSSVGFGPGLWMNSIGHLIAVIAALSLLNVARQKRN